MSLAAITTLVLAGVLVAALAGYLLWVLVILRHLTGTLDEVASGVRAVAARTAPLDPLLSAVSDDLEAVADTLERAADDAGAQVRSGRA